MIVPYPVELRGVSKLPMTFILVALNILLFLMYFSGHKSSLYSSPLLRAEGLALTGKVYQQFLLIQPESSVGARPDWIGDVSLENKAQLGVLGAYALRDSAFIEAAPDLRIEGDAVQVDKWKEDIKHYQSEYGKSVLTQFGLSAQSQGPIAWLTYQFSHSNWIHLLSNVIYLLFIGAAVELVAGSGALLFVYVLGGIAGGLGYIWADPLSITPVIGASACVSALLGFYCIVEPRRRIRYFYFVFPRPNMFGPIYLPTLLILPLFLVVDLASLWSSPAGLSGGVAYSAHLGGSIFGLLFGIIFRIRNHYYSDPIGSV